jgi:hypothetical protein
MFNRDTSSYAKHTEETGHGYSSPVQDMMEVTQVQSKVYVGLLDVFEKYHACRQHEKGDIQNEPNVTTTNVLFDLLIDRRDGALPVPELYN